MKIFILSLAILFAVNANAASLKNLTDKLSTSFGEIVDNTKEKVVLGENENVFRENGHDDVTSELNKLKNHENENNDRNKEALNYLSKEIESLNKLRNSHHKAHEEASSKASQKSSTHSSDETFSSAQQKEILENLPLPDDNVASEVTTPKFSNEKSNSKNTKASGHRLSMKNEQQFAINPAAMLRNLNGKYSAYDIANYVFWSGDEAGVATAVEELIDEGLMSRENAIEFLNDIRLGIDYLENTYSIKQNEGKSLRFTHSQPKITTTTTQDTVGIDEKIPFSYSYNYQKFHSFFKPTNSKDNIEEEDETPTLSPTAIKALKNIPSLIKLTEIHREKERKQPQEESFEIDESGRSRLADFLFGEYSLEEVIYQLAKTMFTQSLTHGSEESQAALQKLTQFLENEGKHGRISPTLQKKILDVLLAALSDTLNENPDIMEKARNALNTK